jgi:hypothetical protein
MSEIAKQYREDLKELNHPLYRFYLRFDIAVDLFLARHPRFTKLSLVVFVVLVEFEFCRAILLHL